jgi:hypothetical protein
MPRTACGTSCSDLNTDWQHCGSCDRACTNPGDTCANGSCARSTPALGCQSCPCDYCTFQRYALCCMSTSGAFCFDGEACP